MGNARRLNGITVGQFPWTVIPANRFKRSMRSSANPLASPRGVSRLLLSGRHG